MKKEYVNLYDTHGRSLGATNRWQVVPDAADYIIFKDGNLIKAKNGKTGVIEFSDTSFSNVLQSAINNQQNGKIAILSETYQLDGQINLASNIEIEGIGKVIIKFVDNYPDDNGFYGLSVSNVTIKNIEFDGNKANNTSNQYDAIHFSNGCNYNKILDNYIHDFPTQGARGYGIIFSEDNNNYNTIVNNLIKDTQRDAIVLRDTSNNNNIIANNTIIFTEDHGVISQKTGIVVMGNYNLIYSNYFDGTQIPYESGNTTPQGLQYFALSLFESKNLVFGNHLYGTVGEVIYDHDGDNIIIGNILRGARGSIGYGIGSAPNNLIIGNYIKDCWQTGIVSQDNNYIVSNFIDGTGEIIGERKTYNGIIIHGSRCVVKSNMITNMYTRDIYISSDATGTQVVSNYLGKGIILDEGTDTYIENNINYDNKRVVTISENHSAKYGEIILSDASAGAISVTLPEPKKDMVVIVKKIDSSTNAVTILPNGSETIDGGTSFSLANQNDYVRLVSDGTNWYSI